MRKIVVGIALALLVTGLTAAPSNQAAAADDLSTIEINCDNDTLVEGAQFVIRATSGVKDFFALKNLGSTHNCVLTDSSGLLTNEATVSPGATVSNIVIEGSGEVTIASSGGTSATLWIDACSLSGDGTASSPWLVGLQDDFRTIGESGTADGDSSCAMSGYYLQTANLSLDHYDLDIVGNGSTAFTGVYDGDHYQLSLTGDTSTGWRYDSNGPDTLGGFSNRGALFPSVSGGTIQKVRLTGEIRTSTSIAGTLVGQLAGDGVISQVESNVNLELSGSSVQAGGIVGQVGDNSSETGGRIQYSKYDGVIEWLAGADGNQVSIGGLVGRGDGDNERIEIRDSYAHLTARYNTDNLGSNAGDEIYVGGLLGKEEKVSTEGSQTVFVRNYALVEILDDCTDPCTKAAKDYVGGLIGLSEDVVLTGDSDFVEDQFVANFFVGSSTAFGKNLDPDSDAPLSYGSLDAAEADGVSTAQLRSITTFITKEDPETAGQAGGDPIDIASSAGGGVASPTLPDYRWAITGGSSTFVPSNYDRTNPDDDPGSVAEQADYTNRTLYPTPADNSKEYLRLRAGVLSAYGGQDPRASTTYTTLGNVWEICDGASYPTLVWEEENCGTGGSSSRNDDDSSTTAAELGLTDAEYAEFLASGLTLEQFLAARLAATGPATGAMTFGAAAVVLLFSLGLALLLAFRHVRTGSLGRTG